MPDVSVPWDAQARALRRVLRAAVWAAPLAVLSLALSGCGNKANEEAGGQRSGPGAASGAARAAGDTPVAVDVVAARAGSLRPELEYTGTTRATREVGLRARVEGRLLSLAADVGDRVERGQALARLDDDLLRAAVNEAEAELASRRSEVTAAQTQVTAARTQVEQARLNLVQVRTDAERAEYLAREGAGPLQTAEQARTAARTAAQVLRSQEQQVRNLQAAVRAAQSRVKAQQAVVAQARERLSYAVLRSPVAGFVTAKLSEAGNLVQPGDEILRIGDFRIAQVDVQVSELELPRVSLGQTVRVALDAYGGRTFRGRVERISPQADPVTRLVPVTITLPNPDNRIGGGLLARVRFGRTAPQRIVIPESAFQTARPSDEPGGAGGGNGGVRVDGARAATPAGDGQTVETVFLLAGDGRAAPAQGGAAPSDRGGQAAGGSEQGDGQAARAPSRVYRVEARRVRVAARADGQAEVVSGLRAGDRVVSRSASPLEEGDQVRPSILSEEAFREADGGDAAPSGGAPSPGMSPGAPSGTGSRGGR